MPERSSKRKKKEHDFNVIAFRVVQQATGEANYPTTAAAEPEAPLADGKNPHAVALGHMGGKKGGKARAERLTPEERSDIARLAAEARWKK